MIGICGGELRAGDALVVRRCQQGMSSMLLLYMALQAMAVHHRLHGTAAGVAAGVQGAALFGMLAMVSVIAQRRFRGTARGVLNGRALLWGAVLTLFTVMVWGFAEAFGPNTVMHVPLLAVPATLVLSTVMAKLTLLAARAR